MSEDAYTWLAIGLCVLALAVSWWARIKEEESDKAAERGRSNLGRSDDFNS